MAQQPTYLLAPSFRFKPGTGPIALGNIIADPLRPHRALTTVEAETLKREYPRVETITDHNRNMTRSNSRNFSTAVWSQFLQKISAKVSCERGANVQTAYTMGALETAYFVTDPPLDVIEMRLKAPRVQAVIKSSSMPGFRHPVYMVTGLMVAKDFAVVQERGKIRACEVAVGGHIASPAGDIGLGANTASSSISGESDMWRTGEDIVFAYQLLKVEVKGWRGTRIEFDELRHKAAYLSKDDSDLDSESDGDETEDEIKGQVTVRVAGVDNLPLSSLEEINLVEVEGSKHGITCISAADGKDY